MTNSRSLILMDQYSQMTISIIEGRGLWALCPSLRCNWQFMAAGEGVPFSSVVEPLVSSSCFSKIIPCPWSSQQHREGFQISGRVNTIKILHTHAWSHQRLYCQIKYHWQSACTYFSIFYINYRFILNYFRRKWISPVQLGEMSSSSNERPEHVSPAVWQASHLEEDILHATTMQAALLGFILCLSVLPHCLLPITGASFTPSGPSSFDLNWSFPQTAGKQLKVNLGKAEEQNKPGKLPGLRAVSWMPALW